MRVPGGPGEAPAGLLGGCNCALAHAFGDGLHIVLANMLFLEAAWAPGGLHEGPGWPWRGSSGAAWRAENDDFH